jgi:LEA14-like dessication related protein
MGLRAIPVAALAALAALVLAACATLPDPVEVTVAGVEPLPGEGMELRMLLKLRVQNPNDAPLEYDGASARLEVYGDTFATGVSDAAGTVPRFGEAIVAVPVTASFMRVARQVMGVADGRSLGKIPYELSGKLSGPGMRSMRFSNRGELELPGAARAPGGT